MTAANGSAVKFYYCEETAGAISATVPEFKPIRFNTATLARTTAQVDSNEINTSRQRPVSKQGTYSLAGDIASELSDDSFDDLLQAALQGTWATNVLKVGSTVRTFAILKRHTDRASVSVSGVTYSASATDNSFNDSGNGFVTAGYAVGDVLTTSGFATAANNGTFRVTTVTAGKLTIAGTDGDAIVTEAAGATVTIGAAMDYIYRGCRISTLAVSAPIDARVGLTFGVIGTEMQTYDLPVGATFTAASTTEPMVTSVGSLTEGGASMAYATAFDFTLNNGMAPLFALFQRPAYDVQNGVATVTGTLSAYRQDGKLYAKHLNETETAFEATFSDGVNTRAFTIPKAIYTQVDDPVSGPEAIVNAYTFSAGYDSTAATTLTITRSA